MSGVFTLIFLADVRTSYQYVGLHNVYRLSSGGIGLLDCVSSYIHSELKLGILILYGQWFPCLSAYTAS